MLWPDHSWAGVRPNGSWEHVHLYVCAQVRGGHTILPCGAAAGSLGLEEFGLLSPASLALVGVKRVHPILDPYSVISQEFQEWT